MNCYFHLPRFYVNTFEHDMKVFLTVEDMVDYTVESTIGAQLIEFLDTPVTGLLELANSLYEETREKVLELAPSLTKHVTSSNMYIRYYETFLVASFASDIWSKKGYTEFFQNFSEEMAYFGFNEWLFKKDRGKVVVDTLARSFTLAHAHMWDCLDYVFKPHEEPEIDKLNPMQRLYIYEEWLLKKDRMPYMFKPRDYATRLYKDKSLELKNSASQEIMAQGVLNFGINMYEVTISENIYQMLRYELIKIISNKSPVKPCKNCGWYFIPEGRSNIDYCSRPVKDLPGKTCASIGAVAVHHRKVKEDPVLQEYMRAYKRLNASMRFSNMTTDEYSVWAGEASRKKEQYQAGELDGDEFMEWLNSDRKYKKRS